MISRIEGLVLRTVRYQDSGLVVALYTREQGRLDVMAKGARSTRRRRVSLQPLALIEGVVYQRPGRELQHLSEWHLAHPWTTLDTHPVKALYGLLLAELLLQAVREHEPNPDVYHLVRATLEGLDTHAAGWYELSLHAAVQLTRHLGFFPHAEDVSRSVGPVRFMAEDGHFASAMEGAADPVVEALRQLVLAPPLEPPVLTLTGPERRALLQLVLRYYQLHLEGFRLPRSLDVFEAVFS